jgi:hypothetical protein
MNSIYSTVVSHGTKILGFMQVTIGVLAGATDIFSPAALKLFIVTNGLLVAWRGFFNSQQGNQP